MGKSCGSNPALGTEPLSVYRGAGDDEGHKIQIGLAIAKTASGSKDIEQSGSDSTETITTKVLRRPRIVKLEASITLPMPSGPLCPAGIGKANP